MTTLDTSRPLTPGEAAIVAMYDADCPPPGGFAERLSTAFETGGSVAIDGRPEFAALRERTAEAGYRLVDGSCGSGAGGWAFVDRERAEVAVLIAYRVVDGRVMVAFHGDQDGREHMPAWVGDRLPRADSAD